MVQGDDEPTESVSKEDHDLGDCEKLLGYTCETCRVWYQEQADEFVLDKDEPEQDWK